jgi:O-antigen/teichoic acid export membrane protein
MLALQTINAVDLWLLQTLDGGRNASTIGLYVAARNVAVVPGVVLMAVSDVVLPSLSRALAADDARLSGAYLQGAVRFLAILIVPVALVLMLAADPLMTLLYSGEFRGGGGYLRVLVVFAAALPFIDLFASALNARGEPYRGGVTLLILIPVAAALNYAFIGRYGAVGAAYASALAGIIGAAVLGLIVFSRFGVFVGGRTLLNTGLATGAMALVARQLGAANSGPVIACVSGVAVYGVTLILLRELRTKDLEPFAFWKWSYR